MSEPWTFGLAPLPATERTARVVRRLTAVALALEAPDPDLDRLLADLERRVEALADRHGVDAPPRVGERADGDGRPYLDHARHIGAFNAGFPEYTITVEGAAAHGTVCFPTPYEGPPGLVHGGFVALFFDCVVQHHNCDVGVAGKTTSLTLRFRRPTPLGRELRFALDRRTDEHRIASFGRLFDGDDLLCEADVAAVAGRRDRLPAVGPRRTP